MFEGKSITHISITTGTILRVFLIALSIYLLWFLRDLALVILTSIVVASFVESSVPYFRKIGISRIPGIVILYVVSLSVLAAMFYLFAPLLITELYNFSTFMASYIPGVAFLTFFPK
jgi:predicted PurR-regulated permease PerM